jgi:tetratricopeptide (TPR) repeat protein
MNKEIYSDTEALDAEKVDEAFEHVFACDHEAARSLLEEVIKNTPEDYQNSCEKDGQVFIKFWNSEQFDLYVESQKGNESKTVRWIPNAYPRAYYLLGYIGVQEEKHLEALEDLEKGLRLEPGNPAFLIKKAEAYVGLGERKKAVSLYDQVLEAGTQLTEKDRAYALRAKGIQLIELGELDVAEESLKESLKYEPESKVVTSQLKYIVYLRSPGIRLVQYSGSPEEVERWWHSWQ